MKWERFQELERERLPAMFQLRERNFLNGLMEKVPPLSQAKIEVEMKAFRSLLEKQIEFLLEGLLPEVITHLAPQPLDRPKSGGWNPTAES